MSPTLCFGTRCRYPRAWSTTRPPLRKTMLLLQMLHSLAQPVFEPRASPVFESTSLKATTSKIKAATTRRSLVFSLSSWRKRCASLTLRPPYLPFHAENVLGSGALWADSAHGKSRPRGQSERTTTTIMGFGTDAARLLAHLSPTIYCATAHAKNLV